MVQLVVMEANPDVFKEDPKYRSALPAQTYESMRALELSIIEKGQLEPISVNKDMVILDGHTRFDIMSNRGMKIKYVIKEFENEEDEFDFVTISNVMRRQLNQFQRVETMYRFIKKQQELRREAVSGNNRNQVPYMDVIKNIIDGNNTIGKISESMGVSGQYVGKILKQLMDDFVVSRNEIRVESSNGSKKSYEYNLMPKAYERMEKEKTKLEKPKGMTNIMITKNIGVSNNTLVQSIYCIENAKPRILEMLREGRIGIGTAYSITIGTMKKINPKDMEYWRANDDIQCPHCKNITKKHNYIKVKQDG